MFNDASKLERIVGLGLEMGEVKDVDILLERVLAGARELVNADAGSIYITQGKELKFIHAQNKTLQNELGEGKKLVYRTFLIPVNNTSIAGYVAMNNVVLNIPDVYRLSQETPYKFAKEFDAISEYRTVSMLTLPLKTSRGITIGVLQLINAQNAAGEIVPFADKDIPLMTYFANSAAILLERAELSRAIILRMMDMAKMRDPHETGPHVNRVAAYAVELYEAWARRYGMDQGDMLKKMEVLRMAAMLHDVGKVGISDMILKKPGKLTPEEYEVMQQHTIIGAKLFGKPRSELDEAAGEVALNHHERWDGTGYPGHVDPITGLPLPDYANRDGSPKRKHGDEIPIFGRVVAVTDVYDALCSKRVYKEAWKEQDAVEELDKQSGKQFDPELIELFHSIHDRILSLKGFYPDEGEI